MIAASSASGGPARWPSHVGPIGSIRPGIAAESELRGDPVPDQPHTAGGRGQPERRAVQAVRDQNVGGRGGAVHCRRFERSDSGVGAGRGVGAGVQQLAAHIGQIPAAGQVQRTVQFGAGLNQCVDKPRVGRGEIRLGQPFQDRVAAGPGVNDLRVVAEDPFESVEITPGDCAQGGRDAATVATGANPPQQSGQVHDGPRGGVGSPDLARFLAADPNWRNRVNRPGRPAR